MQHFAIYNQFTQQWPITQLCEELQVCNFTVIADPKEAE